MRVPHDDGGDIDDHVVVCLAILLARRRSDEGEEEEDKKGKKKGNTGHASDFSRSERTLAFRSRARQVTERARYE